MKYQIGDFVRIVRRFDNTAKYYSYPGVCRDMLEMTGKVYQISRYSDNTRYYYIRGWMFTDDMIAEKVCRVGDEYIPYSENMARTE